jgi:hypothetical protein
VRNYSNWLQAFIEYASYGEAPRHMYFWTGVSTIAGVLRRKCWIDQAYFKWYPNFYVVLVAPPGIVSKSTTVGIGMDLLRQVPGVKFGPEIVTWQALATSFVNAAETFEYQGLHHTQSALTIESSEFGNLLNPQDKEMVDVLVTLWDGKGLRKETKHSGSDEIINPWINLIACTTPSWIAGNFPEYMIGGGLTSRMVFVYAEEKTKYVAYPKDHVPVDMKETAAKLIADLEQIAINCVGEYKFSSEAVAYGEKWYKHHYTHKPAHLDDDRFGGYIARKQTHMHKLAMVLAAAESDEMILTAEHLDLAHTMVTDLEPDMAMVFSKIGKSDESFYMDRMVAYVRRVGRVPYADLYRVVYAQFPSLRNFEDVFSGCLRAGFIKTVQEGNVVYVEAITEAMTKGRPRTG